MLPLLEKLTQMKQMNKHYYNNLCFLRNNGKWYSYGKLENINLVTNVSLAQGYW